MARIFKSVVNIIYTYIHRCRFCYWGKGAHIAWKASRLTGLKYVSVGSGTSIASHVQ